MRRGCAALPRGRGSAIDCAFEPKNGSGDACRLHEDSPVTNLPSPILPPALRVDGSDNLHGAWGSVCNGSLLEHIHFGYQAAYAVASGAPQNASVEPNSAPCRADAVP